MKEKIRRQMRQARRALSLQQQQQAAIALWLQFRNSPLFLSSKRIAIYLANDGEIDPSFLSRCLLQQKRQLFLPRIDRLGLNRMKFGAYQPSTLLTHNRYGILEPSQNQLVKPLSLDLVLLPLVAFDSRGNRLGMGGGFYDRTFAFKRQNRKLGPTLVGLAHECQKTEDLSTSSWDIPLDAVLTDKGYIRINNDQLKNN